MISFSILERIDVGETTRRPRRSAGSVELSVSSNGSTWVKLTNAEVEHLRSAGLSVSSNGSTWVKHHQQICRSYRYRRSFSILERIDVGETRLYTDSKNSLATLSVSSNGSTWVKPLCFHPIQKGAQYFQYPRTDRRG